ncbi:unnamed protein product, partial [Protopolystoma xenopodis]
MVVERYVSEEYIAASDKLESRHGFSETDIFQHSAANTLKRKLRHSSGLCAYDGVNQGGKVEDRVVERDIVTEQATESSPGATKPLASNGSSLPDTCFRLSTCLLR